MSENAMHTYRRLLGYLRPHRGRLLGAILASQGFAIATAMVSATLYAIINGLQNRNEVIVNNIPHVPQIHEIRFPAAWIPFLVVGVFFARSFFEYIAQYQMASVGIRVIRKLRDDLYRHLVYLSHDFYAKGRTGDFLSRIMNDVGSIQGALTDVIADLIKQPFIILYNIPMVFLWGGPYALIAVLIFPIVAVPIVVLGRKLRKTTQRMQERAAEITAFISETLTGFAVIKAFYREEYVIQKFERINKSVFEFFKKTIRITLVQRPLIEVMGACGAALGIWFALERLPADRFGAFVISLFVFYEPLKKLSKVNSTIQQSIAAGNRIFEILDARPSVEERPWARSIDEPVEEIAYEHVFFAYTLPKYVLEDIHFKVQKGEVIAIVGASGSGKTTLVNLLPRFYDPIQGCLRINGKDIRDFKLHSLRALIGLVTQETILFDGTIAENIAFGRPNIDREAIRRAAEIAYADHFIQKLPQGYDTPLGERGLQLSGGQRQRIAIARALVSDPPILIFDEATSHLDTESEHEVQKALENSIHGRTVFIIAHRLSTIQKANRILVLDNGRIVQQGTNESLLQEEGVYRKLYKLQFRL